MSAKKIPRLAVSGLRGGSGKTLLTLSLIAACKERGLAVTPFKKGPDYIDAGWLAKASGVPCYNLDLFMMTEEQVVNSFTYHAVPPLRSDAKGGDGETIALIEGNRGLFDGLDHEGTFSTAALAKLLHAPVIITIDCTKVSGTVAAMLLGCQKMDPALTIGGVVLNRVATARQESVIRKAINGQCRIPVLGVIPKLKKDPFPERHMGLIPYQEHGGIGESIAAVEKLGDTYLDVEGIIAVAQSAGALADGQEAGGRSDDHHLSKEAERMTQNSLLKIGIIRDSAFQFYYQENLDALVNRGARLIEASPLQAAELPDIDALYIGGGFPETHAIRLAENRSFRNSLYSAIEKGLPVYAECGGLMYLGKQIIMEGNAYPMVGSLPAVFGLEKRPKAHGYTVIEVAAANPYFAEKTVLRGHEFHYSHLLEMGSDAVTMVFHVKRGKGIADHMDGICYKNVLATYTHLHAIGSPEWADGIITAARAYRASRHSS